MVRSISGGIAAGLVVLGLIGWPQPAAAQVTAVTPEGATALAEVIDKGVRQWFPPTGDNAAFQWDGRARAGVEGDHYLVELPSLQITNEDGSRLGVGVVRMALTPVADGNWDLSLTLPSPIAMLAADGKPEGELTIGRQSFTGRWAPKLETLTRANGVFGDIKAASRKDKSLLEIGAITITTDLAESAPGRWSGPSALELKQLAVTDERGVKVGRLGSAALEAEVTGMDLNHAATLNQKAEALPAGDSTQALRKRLGLLNGLFRNARGQARIADLAITSPGDGTSFALGRIAARLGVEGFDQEKSTISLGYEHGGLKVEPPPGPADFMPATVELELAAANLPNTGLWAAFTKVLDSPTGKDETVGQAMVVQLLATLTQAGAKLQVGKLKLDSPALAGLLKGEARFNDKSAMGVDADVDITLRGLDAAAKLLQPPPGTKPDEETQNLLAMISMVQAFGMPSKDAAGQEVRAYQLKLAADGRMLLNGADMSALLGGGPAQPAPQPPPVKGGRAPETKSKSQ